jgi:hypothetical protein
MLTVKRKFQSYIFTHLFLLSIYCQDTIQALDWTPYFKKIEKGDSLYNCRQYYQSALAYSNAFASIGQGFSIGHKFQAARAWAKIKATDSAIANLEREAWEGYNEYEKLISERSFRFLRKDPRWIKLSETIKENQRTEDLKLGIYKPIKIKLEEILMLDQKYRRSYMDKWKQYGLNSQEMISIQKKMKRVDRSNLKYVTTIIEKYGWISYDTIGVNANQTLFLVIQHADSATQEKYLPVMRLAVQQKKAKNYDFALLEDRVLIRRGEKQKYGSQLECDSSGLKCWVLPIADEKNVDNRRKAIGLPPLDIYLKLYGIAYKLPE